MRDREYYFPELGIDGTAEKLFINLRNGYEDNPKTVEKMVEIFEGEGLIYETLYAKNWLDKEEYDPVGQILYRAKLDLCDTLRQKSEIKLCGDSATDEEGRTAEVWFEYNKGRDQIFVLFSFDDSTGSRRNGYPVGTPEEFIRKSYNELLAEFNEALSYTPYEEDER